MVRVKFYLKVDDATKNQTINFKIDRYDFKNFAMKLFQFTNHMK